MILLNNLYLFLDFVPSYKIILNSQLERLFHVKIKIKIKIKIKFFIHSLRNEIPIYLILTDYIHIRTYICLILVSVVLSFPFILMI